jgi:hypothetical protein
VKATRVRVLLRLGIAFAIGALCLLAFTPGHGNASASTFRTAAMSLAQDSSPSCPPEANSCAPVMNLPCLAGSCPVTAGPVSQLGQGQAVYVDISGLASGEQVALGLCALTTGTTPTPDPTCASYLPPAPGCTDSCDGTSSPLEWQYATGAGGETVLSIGTEFDPNIPDAHPIISETVAQYGLAPPDNFGSFFCDNGPANPCGIEVIDLGPTQGPGAQGYVIGDGFPPASQSKAFLAAGGSTPSNTVVIPLNWASSGSGCQSAPIMEVDASYSVSQFLPAAGGATCSGPDGVAVLPTSMPSVDDSTCQSSGVTHCPITEVINGSSPATFTDDPNDPTTLAELQQAGGKFAYIPIAVSSTEITFAGQTGRTGVGAITYPLSSYNLTPAQTAGIMTQLWTSPIASLHLPQDDLCSQLSGPAQCTETPQIFPITPTVYTVDGQYANVAVNGVSGGTPTPMPFNFLEYEGTGSNPYFGTSTKSAEKNYAGDTGYALLNQWPFNSGPTPTTENVLESMFPSTASGASYETTGWICAAPDAPYNVNLPFGGTALLTDLQSGPQILADAEQDPIEMTQQTDGSWTENPTVAQQIQSDPKGCEALSSLPTNFASTTPAGGAVSPYSPSSQPLIAAHTIQGVISKGALGFAFSAMDSSEADFFGLLPASLQNAGGVFVPPSSASVTAALSAATAAPNGTLIPNFTNTNPAAYPMPMVTYALISTSPQASTDQADQLTELLTNLVNYSHTGGAGSSEPLPPGYVPLPDNLAQQALTEISKDVIAPNGQPVGGEAAAAASLAANSASHSGAAASSNSSSGGPFSFSSALGAPFGVNGLAKSSGSSGAAKSGSNSSGGGGSSENPIGRFIAVTLGDNRYLVPGLLLLALICLVAGPLLYMSPSLRKPATAADGGGEGAGDEGESPPPLE